MKSGTRQSRLTIWCKNTYNSTIYYYRISKKRKLLIFREVHIITSRWRHTTKSSSKIYSIMYKFCVYAMLVLCSNTTTFFAKQFWNMVNFPENTRFYSCFYLTWCHNDVIRQKFWYQKLRNQISNKPMKILWKVVKRFSEYFRKTEKNAKRRKF